LNSQMEAKIKNAKSILSIPLSTYRFQFHKEFPIQKALEQNLPQYIKDLGVAYCYSSPLLQARPGSTHGYDVCDHKHINPDIATDQQFVELSQQLQKNGLGLLLDIVPNHVGIGAPASRWWMDVLEHGKGSVFADYFDIKWEKHQDRLLAPFLGSPIGTVLQNGELKVKWNEHEILSAAEGKPIGALQLFYYDNPYPLDPSTLPPILEKVAKDLPSGSPALSTLQGVINKFKSLSSRNEIGQLNEEHAKLRKERRLNAFAAKEELSKLMGSDKATHDAVVKALEKFNEAKDESVTHLVLAQPYRLCYWKVASDDLNYRRFFDINELLAIKAERQEVFEDSLELVCQWIKEGHVTALRLDHPDGLYDPVLFFQQLQTHVKKFLPANFSSIDESADKPLYVLVEKILEPGESLSTSWPVSGTVGYEFLNVVNDVFVDKQKESALRKIYEDFVANTYTTKYVKDFEGLLYKCKKYMMNTSMETELNSLSIILGVVAKQSLTSIDFTEKQLKTALRELVASFPVYRTYVTLKTSPSTEDIKFIDESIKSMRKRAVVDSLIIDFLEQVLLCKGEDKLNSDQVYQRRHFVMKFQQLTGPCMAKGLEDTSFYRFFLLTSLNEVGGDPNNFGLTKEQFHDYNVERIKKWPQTMSNSSTHDTKRSEDVRSRINVLSEIPEEWSRVVAQWQQHNIKYKQEVGKLGLVPAPNEEYMIYQTLIGVWPLGAKSADDTFLDRIKAFATKSMKEAKMFTSWSNQNKPYEDAVLGFIEKIVKDAEFVKVFLAFAEKVFKLGKYNSLSQTVLKILSPGIPDIYQGQELWDFSLVDPDNRRPVDYSIRKKHLGTVKGAVAGNTLGALASSAIQDNDDSGLIKLLITERLLNLRNQHPALFFKGTYNPLKAQGSLENHVIAFERKLGDANVFVVTSRFFAGNNNINNNPQVWKDTKIQITTSGKYKEVLTGRDVNVSSDLTSLEELFQQLPFAILEKL